MVMVLLFDWFCWLRKNVVESYGSEAEVTGEMLRPEDEFFSIRLE